MHPSVIALLLFSSLVTFTACSSGSSGGGGSDVAPTPTVSVPEGSGLQAIEMAGSWEVRLAEVVSSSVPEPVAPENGTVFVLDESRILSMDGLDIQPDPLVQLFGAPLEVYVNEVDGQTLMYRVVVDTRADGGTREETVVAGGSLDVDSIAVEAMTSSQSATDVQPSYTLCRYTLFRQSTRSATSLSSEAPSRDADSGR